MFARTCPRMGMRFASGNVYYMNRTFTARHLQCVGSPLWTGFITPMRFASALGPQTTPGGCGLAPSDNMLVDATIGDDLVARCLSAATTLECVGKPLEPIVMLASRCLQPIVCLAQEHRETELSAYPGR
jgi:hypothetical protein